MSKLPVVMILALTMSGVAPANELSGPQPALHALAS